MWGVMLQLASLCACVALAPNTGSPAKDGVPPKETADCYLPVEGGWQLRITGDPKAPRLKPGSAIGVAADDPRMHRRPLYPAADRSLIWTKAELAKRQRIPFRPLVLAANEPQFVIDLDSAGGLSGHFLLGVSWDHGPSKWLHQFTDIEVRYVEGRMEYALHDAAFPQLLVRLRVLPLADSVGLVMGLGLEGVSHPGELVWAFGGASGFVTNYDHTAPQFRYSPEQCDDNTMRCDNGRFTLLRNQKAVLHCGSSWSETCGLGDPRKVLDSPAALCASAEWPSAAKAAAEPKRVAVQKVRLGKMPLKGWIVIGQGGAIETCLADPRGAEERARARNRSIMERITVHTPDPYLNQAMPMMALASEGIWGDAAILHGGWSWRQAYLGWRGWYGPLCYGWTERVKRSIEQHCTLGLIREGPNRGALSHMLEYENSLFYNMDEVFLDHVRQYFDYTNDVELMRKIFPVLKGIVEWEGRRLQPAEALLYESSLDTWISDSHWYTRANALRPRPICCVHQLLAELAEALGEDPAPYRNKAKAIRNAMQQTLWQKRRGVFAECLDTLGARQLHPEPELPTIYHSAEFGAASPLQVYEMLHWADHNLRHETTPGGGRAVWSSSWAPNHGRSYTHSTYELAFEEQLNLAVADYLVGRADDAYALLRSALCGIYNGATPGGLTCHMFVDGRQRANNEFADAISMWGRAVVEGMYGIQPKRPHGIVQLSPQFPISWSEASIHTRQFAYQWKRENGRISVHWESPLAAAIELRLPLQAKRVEQVLVNGKKAAYRLERGVGLVWLTLTSPSAISGTISVDYVPAEIATPKPVTWKEGDPVALNCAAQDLDCLDLGDRVILDPQGVLGAGTLAGTVVGEPGTHVLFLKSGTDACPFWSPLTVLIEPRQPVAKPIWSPPRVKAKDVGRMDADQSEQSLQRQRNRRVGPGGQSLAAAEAAGLGSQLCLLEGPSAEPRQSRQPKRCGVAEEDRPGPGGLDARWNSLQERVTGKKHRRGHAGRRIPGKNRGPRGRRRQRTLLDAQRHDLPRAKPRGQSSRHARLRRRLASAYRSCQSIRDWRLLEHLVRPVSRHGGQWF